MASDAWVSFLSSDMVESLTLMAQLRGEAAGAGMPELGVALTQVMADLDVELTANARRVAAYADERIRDRIRSTQKRPDTLHPIHLIDTIKSQPLPFGAVAVGLIDELNRAENPETGGVYWRAQEEGSVAVGNKMTGRILFGRFVGEGYSAPPIGEMSGANTRLSSATNQGSEFMWGDLSGEPPGFGTIQHEIEPRRFLRSGANIAFAEYQREISDLSRRYASRVAALSADVAF